MDEVLWHSTTLLLAKSIFVKMPKLPTIRVIGSQDISTIFSGWVRASFTGAGAVDMVLSFYWLFFWATQEPGGGSMNGINLAGKPGMVHPMQMPPTFGQPPIPSIQPRLVTLQFTTGPQHPSFTMHFGEP